MKYDMREILNKIQSLYDLIIRIYKQQFFKISEKDKQCVISKNIIKF